MMAIAPRLVGRMAIATALFSGLHTLIGGRPDAALALPGWLIVASFTLCHFLCDDLSKYLVHRALHRWPVLWAFHKVHHSATTLTPLTVYRTHPLEAVIFSLRGTRGAGQSWSRSSFSSLAARLTSTPSSARASSCSRSTRPAPTCATRTFVSATGGGSREWLMSPAQHQIHHSVEERHHDKNFGTVLSLWDWLGGTLCLAEKGRDSSATG